MEEAQFQQKLEYMEQVFFANDTPLPFKGDLKIYPVKIKDYYKFYSLVSCFTMDKNTDIENMGIKKSHLDYALFMAEKDKTGFGMRFVELLKLVFNLENAIICDNKECDFEEQEIYGFYAQLFALQEEYKGANIDRRKEIEDKVDSLCRCPKCGTPLREKIFMSFKEKERSLFIGYEKIGKDEYDFLRRIYCYQNILDYDDSYVDPELKEAIEERKRLESAGAENPSLEKQEAAVITGSSYTFETIKELTLRKFTVLLRIIEAKLQYEAMRTGEMSGMVTFKNPIPHWLYSGNKKKSIMDEVTSLDSFKGKFQENGNATVN